MFARRFAFAVVVVLVIACIASLSWGGNDYCEKGRCISVATDPANPDDNEQLVNQGCHVPSGTSCSGRCTKITGETGSYCDEKTEASCTNREKIVTKTYTDYWCRYMNDNLCQCKWDTALDRPRPKQVTIRSCN